jgi:hypothetical protein
VVALFDYPKKAKFGRMVAKSKIYGRVKPSRKIQENFVTQVGKITWAYKLAPETINLPAQSNIKEIEVFEIALKSETIDQNILKCIDKAIAHPIIFHLVFNEQIKIIATNKRPSEADTHKWVIGDNYFSTEWQPIDTPREALPVALDIAALYEHLLRAIMPQPARDGEELSKQVERLGLILLKEKEHKKLEARIGKEKQFNRKVEMNAKARTLAREIEKLRK